MTFILFAKGVGSKEMIKRWLHQLQKNNSDRNFRNQRNDSLNHN